MTQLHTLEPQRRRLLELSDLLASHLRLLRDYGTTPGNVWLARGELNKIGEVTGEIEMVLQEIKALEG